MRYNRLKRAFCFLLSFVMIASSFCIASGAEGGYDADFSANWAEASEAASFVPDPIGLTLDLTETTNALVFDEAVLSSLCCCCADGAECNELSELSAENAEIRLDSNAEMLKASFYDGEEGIYAKLTPTEYASVGKEVAGALWLQKGEHRTQEIRFTVEFTGQWGTIKKDLPDYTLTRSDSLAYANNVPGWNSTPQKLEISVHSREQFEIALCTDYWANVETSGYNENLRLLSVDFTNGEGLLDFYVHIGSAVIWGGASCELLTVVPTDAAYEITQPTTVTGTVSLYWTGWTTMEFSVTILPQLPNMAESKSEQTAIASAASGWNLTPPKLEEALSVREKRIVTLCTSFWANTEASGYNAELRLLSNTVTEGEDLLDFYVSIGEGTIWGGTEAELLTIVPKDAAFSITEPVTVSGKLGIYWTNWTELPYSITLTPYESTEPAQKLVYAEVLNSDTSCCNDDWIWTGTGDRIATLPSGQIYADQTYVAPVASEYWTFWDEEQHNYSASSTLTSATVATGRDLVTVSLRVRSEDTVWGGSECVFAEITPTEKARSITEDTVVSGTFHMYYRPWYSLCTVPFTVTLKKKTADVSLTQQISSYMQSIRQHYLQPYTASFRNADEKEYFSVLLNEQVTDCSILVGSEYVSASVGQNVLTVTPTEKARAQLLLGNELTVRGMLQNAVPFVLTLSDGVQAPQFETDHLYATESALPAPPLAMQAELVLPKNQQSAGGTIFGDYIGVEASFTFGIGANGVPRLFYQSSWTVYQEVVFGEVHVNTGKPVQLAVTKDGDTFRCYVDGELKQTVVQQVSDVVPENEFILGGDLREGNTACFSGVLRNAAFYSAVRSADELRTDWLGTENLICGYQLAGMKNEKIIPDIAGCFDLQYDRGWLDPSEVSAPSDYAYSVAVLGDIQKTTYFYPEMLPIEFDWIVSNRSENKISYVIGLGDTTDGDTPAEWALTKQQYSKFDGFIPYQVVRGNHDSTVRYNQFFASGGNADGAVCMKEGSYENSYRLVTLGNTDYLMLQLDYGASDEVLAWAGEIIEEYPERRVIICTHAYAYIDGTTQDDNDHVTPTGEGFPNNGDDYWDKLVKKYANIEMVICGHEPDRDVLSFQTKGDNGNLVTQMLVDPQSMDIASPKGMVCLLYFSEDGNVVDVRWYSTVRNQFYQMKNQRRIVLNDVVQPSASYDPATDELTVLNAPQDSKTLICGYLDGKFSFVRILQSTQKATVPISESCDSIKVMFVSSAFTPVCPSITVS